MDGLVFFSTFRDHKTPLVNVHSALMVSMALEMQDVPFITAVGRFKGGQERTVFGLPCKHEALARDLANEYGQDCVVTKWVKAQEGEALTKRDYLYDPREDCYYVREGQK
jgi:hypothetical protein